MTLTTFVTIYTTAAISFTFTTFGFLLVEAIRRTYTTQPFCEGWDTTETVEYICCELILRSRNRRF